MRKYDNEFKLISEIRLNLKKNKEKKYIELIKFCDECNIQKKVDTHNCLLICERCGNCSPYVIYIDNFDKNIYDIKRHSGVPYSRYRHLERKIKNKQINNDDNNAIIGLFFKFIIPYDKIYKDRSNMIRYDYIIMKFLKMLNKHHLTYKCKKIKTKKILKEYDAIWKIVCKDLNWECK